MKKLIKTVIDYFLLSKTQIRIQSKTKSEVLQLIERLHPIKTDKSLVRLGPTDDGGYLVPDDLDGIEACISPGVYAITDFEYHCLDRGMNLLLADKAIAELNINASKDRYSFISKFIGVTNNKDFITLDTWVNQSNISKDGDLMLQMDIEGWEYFAFLNVSNELLKRFRVIIVEFHNLQNLWIPSFYAQANAVFSKLFETHTCVHVHPNNYAPIHTYDGVDIPPLAEFTFYRNDRVQNKGYAGTFPTPLDSDNVVNNPSIHLPKQWYRTSV